MLVTFLQNWLNKDKKSKGFKGIWSWDREFWNAFEGFEVKKHWFCWEISVFWVKSNQTGLFP